MVAPSAHSTAPCCSHKDGRSYGEQLHGTCVPYCPPRHIHHAHVNGARCKGDERGGSPLGPQWYATHHHPVDNEGSPCDWTDAVGLVHREQER